MSTAGLGEGAVHYFVELAMGGKLDLGSIPQIFAEQHVYCGADLWK